MNRSSTDCPEALAAAVVYAARAHATQSRKRAAGDDRPGIPHLSHLLGVAGIVIEDGGSLDDAIAGLLHDVLEDQDHKGTRAGEIKSLFGADVLAIVKACSGPKKEDPGMAEFRVRKRVYLARLRRQRNVSPIRCRWRTRCTTHAAQSTT